MKKILLIEDEEDIRDVYSEYLELAGYKVITAANGDDGLNMAKKEDWDLMLLDIMIPKVNGRDLLKHMHENFLIRSRPIIMLTNLGEESLITECLESGASGYLIKAEITPDKILNEVQNYLETGR